MTAPQTNSPEVLLDAHGLKAWYGAAQILYDINLQVRRGEVVALMGRNGAGKSTTLKTLMGLMDKHKGTVRFMANDISDSQPHQIASLGMGFVPEHPLTLEESFLGTNSRRMESLSFVAPMAYVLDWLMFFSDKSKVLTLGVVAVFGVVTGAAASALSTRTFRWEGFGNTEDTANHLVGAVLMGFGGVTAMGCTVGQGLSGVSLLAAGSFIAIGAIVVGAVTGTPPNEVQPITITIPKESIGAVIGPGGRVIQEIQAETGAHISIDEVDGMGHVEIMSENKASIDAALAPGIVRTLPGMKALMRDYLLPAEAALRRALHILAADLPAPVKKAPVVPPRATSPWPTPASRPPTSNTPERLRPTVKNK